MSSTPTRLSLLPRFGIVVGLSVVAASLLVGRVARRHYPDSGDSR